MRAVLRASKEGSDGPATETLVRKGKRRKQNPVKKVVSAAARVQTRRMHWYLSIQKRGYDLEEGDGLGATGRDDQSIFRVSYRSIDVDDHEHHEAHAEKLSQQHPCQGKMQG